MNKAKHGWIITKDCLEKKDVCIIGPSNISNEIEAKLKAGEGKAFSLHDDDNEAYFRGRYIGADDENMFSPLDDYGTPDSGCTTIKYNGITL